MNNARLQAATHPRIRAGTGCLRQRSHGAQVLAEVEKVKAQDWSRLAGLPDPQSMFLRIGHGDSGSHCSGSRSGLRN